MHMNCRLVRCPDQRRYQIVFSKCLCFGDIRKRGMGARYINWMISMVSEPDPQKIKKEGLVNGLGWKCTPCLVCGALLVGF